MMASLILGLSSCDMMSREPGGEKIQNIDYSPKNTIRTDARTTEKHKASSENYSKEPVQKTTPGPKRAAAPQLPVIQ